MSIRPGPRRAPLLSSLGVATAAAAVLAFCPSVRALDFLGQPLPAWATVAPRGSTPLTEQSVVGQWQEDLQPGIRESNGRPSFPGMTWIIRADHTLSIYGSCRDGKPRYAIDATWRLDEHRFLQIAVHFANGAHKALGTMPGWMVDGKLALPPDHQNESGTLEHYEGPLPPVCPD